MKSPKNNRILYFIQLPPPIHGVSIINKLVYESGTINSGFQKKLLRLRFASSINDLRRFNPRKILVAIILQFQLIYNLIFYRPRIVYFSFMPVGFGFWRDFVYLMTIKLFGAKPVLHLDNQGIASKSKNSFKRLIYEIAFKNCCIIHVNQWLLKKEFSQLKLTNSSLHFVHNTIESIEELKGKILPKKQILFLSNLFPIKGATVLIKAFVTIANNFPEYQLVISGEFPSKSIERKLKKLVNKFQLQQRIIFTGGVYGEEKFKLLAESKVFVLPSLTDCFPLVILEAMHFGVPVVTTKVGGLHTIFNEDEEIIFIDPITPNELSKKLQNLISNNQLCHDLGMSGKIKASQISANFENDMANLLNSI